MDYLEIQRSDHLSGEIKISGAKNAALPLIAMSILAKNEMQIEQIPQVMDIKTLLKLLQKLGANYEQNGDILSIDTSSIHSTKATYDIVKTMRASILTLGPLLTRFKEATVSLPGGCAIGERPVDLHIKAFMAMGAEVAIKAGYINAKVDKHLKGATIVFDKITVTGCENVVMAAAMAKRQKRYRQCCQRA